MNFKWFAQHEDSDAGYVGVVKREDMQEALAANGQTVRWHVAKRRKTIEKRADGWHKSMAQAGATRTINHALRRRDGQN